MNRRLVPSLLLPLLAVGGCSPWYGLRLDLFPDGVESVRGVNVTPIDFGYEPREDVVGAAIGPLHSDVRSVTGLHVAGLLARSDGTTGVSAGLMVGADGDVDGVTVAPLVFTPYRHSDLGGEFDGAARGIQLAGILLDFPHQRGVSIAGVLRARTLTGLGAGYVFTDVRDRMVGLSIGLVNRAKRLKGVQLGLLNRVAERAEWWRWMPLVNVGWDAGEDGDEVVRG
ncbi:MAG: LA_2272 family surface repeat-containing protein [Planctomycetota bacterium JB042]